MTETPKEDIRRATIAEIREMVARDGSKTDFELLRQAGDFEGPDDDDFEIDWSSARLVPPMIDGAPEPDPQIAPVAKRYETDGEGVQ